MHTDSRWKKAKPGSRQSLQVQLSWGDTPLDVKVFGPSTRRITIGPDEGSADMAVPFDGLSAQPSPFLRRTEAGASLAIPDGVTGHLELTDGTRIGLENPDDRLWIDRDPDLPECRTLDLPDGATAKLLFGQLELTVRPVERPAGFVSRLFDRVDSTYPNALAIALVFFSALVATIHLRPGEVAASEEQMRTVPDRYVQWLLERPKPEKRDLVLMKDLSAELLENRASERLKGREGEAGLRDRLRTAHRTAVRGNQDTDRARVHGSGLVAVLNNSGQAGLLPGQQGPDLGADLETAIGKLTGPTPGQSGGLGGWGLVGDGPGGGRNGDTIGTADVRTRGRHWGGPDYGPTRRRPGRPVAERSVDIRVSRLDVIGPLSMEMVRAVIDSHRDQIRYCYSQELIRSPKLSGKVTVRFTIGERGWVVQAGVASSSIPSSRLQRCITDRVRTWKFPQPRGGGSVLVNYPFLFRAPGT